MAAWARKVARNPSATTPADVQALRDAGLGDGQIFAITAFVALRLAFSTINEVTRQVRSGTACGSVLAMSVSVVSPVFIGRQQEMALLAAPMRRAEDGEPAVVLIGGEAGVGKTRLVGELAGLGSAAGFWVLTGQCIEMGAEGLPLAPLVDALRALARTTPADELRELLGPAGSGLARLLPELGPGPGAPAAGEGLKAGQLLELVLGLLGRLSADRPVMFVIEDLHWADPSTLDLAAFLVRALRAVPVLMVITYRSDELHRRHPLRPLVSGWERVRSVDHIELRRFGRDEVAAQLAAILGGAPAPWWRRRCSTARAETPTWSRRSPACSGTAGTPVTCRRRCGMCC